MPDPRVDFPVKLAAAGAEFTIGTNLWRGNVRPKQSNYPHTFVRVLPIALTPFLGDGQGDDYAVLVQCTVVGERRQTVAARDQAKLIRDYMHRLDMTAEGYWETRCLSSTPTQIEQDDDDRPIFVVDFRLSWVA